MAREVFAVLPYLLLERDLPDPKVSGILPRGMALSEDRRALAAQGPPGVPASCTQALGPQKLKQVTEMLLFSMSFDTFGGLL